MGQKKINTISFRVDDDEYQMLSDIEKGLGVLTHSEALRLSIVTQYVALKKKKLLKNEKK